MTASYNYITKNYKTSKYIQMTGLSSSHSPLYRNSAGTATDTRERRNKIWATCYLSNLRSDWRYRFAKCVYDRRKLRIIIGEIRSKTQAAFRVYLNQTVRTRGKLSPSLCSLQLRGGAPHADFSAGKSVCHAGPACRVGSRRTKENPDSIPSVGVTELASIVVTTMAGDEVEFMQTDVFVNYCVICAYNRLSSEVRTKGAGKCGWSRG